MCYSLTLQSSIHFRNLHSLKINGDRSSSTSNLASLWFPSSPVIDRRRISPLFTVRFFRKLRFFGGNDAADLCRAPINRLSVRYCEARRTLEYLHDAAAKNTAEIDRRRNSSLYTPRCLVSSRFGLGGNAAADLCRGNRLGVHCSGRNDAEAVTAAAAAAAGQPDFSEFITSERVKVVAMLALALALCNADRVVMSVAIVPLSISRGWSKSFSGIVQSSFLWGYLVSPIAGGALVDRYGGKVVMAWGVALWSLATFLTPWAADTSLWALLASRAMVGVAEGVALPCMNNMVARWFPSTERSRAVGIAMAGFQLGNVVGLMLSPILMSQGGIYGPFVIFGLSGFLWLLVWLSATSSAPDMHPQITKSELEYIKQTPDKAKERKATGVIPPFRRLLSKMPTWAVIVANSMHSWGFFVILSWMPIYFNSVYHVNLKQAAWFSAVPWSMMAFTGYIAGSWSDLLIRRGTTITLTRKIMQSIGFIGPGIALIGLTTAKQPLIASAWLSLAVGLKSFSHLGFLINLQEIAPEYSGVLHGMCLTAGTLAAIVGTIGAGFFVELLGSFQGFIMLTAILYLLSALFYNVYSTGERVDFDTTG